MLCFMTDGAGRTFCDVCRRRYEPDKQSTDWIEITADRNDEYWYVDFCCQELAALWFSRPFPTPTQLLVRTRLADARWAVFYLGLAALAASGIATVIRWIWP